MFLGFFLFRKFILEPLFDPFLKNCQKMTEKKVVGSKNDINKSCPKFCKLGDEFFYFDEISKMKLLRLKNDILKMYIIQGAYGKSGIFLIACIYPCNGRTRPSKVPLETYRSQEDFDVFHV